MTASDRPSGGKPRIGFLGLGNMGGRMARRLLDAGYPMTVWDRKHEHAEPLADAGAAAGRAPADVAIGCDVLCTSVTDDRAVRDLFFGGGTQDPGAAAAGGLGVGQTVIELSTILPMTAQTLGEQLSAQGVALLDVGVSGSTPQAQVGVLVVLAGGEEAVFGRCRPILDVIGKAAFHMGPAGSGKKDLNLISARAAELSVPMPVVSAALQAFGRACATERGSEDFSVVIRAAEQAAGLPASALPA
jgi:3-hydroxyisobutyrate dehydrogenase